MTEGEITSFELRRIQLEECAHIVDHPDVLMELYRTAEGGCSTKFAYYSVRWSISCGDKAIEDALRTVLQDRRLCAGTNDQTPMLRELEDEDDVWSEGVILGTSAGDYAANLSWILADKELGAFSSRRLGEVLRAQLVGNKEEPLEIRRIRVNTAVGDFVFDIAPAEGSADRYISVLSHVDLSDQLARLYACSERLQTEPTELRQRLAAVLQGGSEGLQHA